MCDIDIVPPKDIITYESLVQESTREYNDLVNSNQWEPATDRGNYQDQPSLLRAHTVAIYQSANKDLNQVGLKSHCIGNVSG